MSRQPELIDLEDQSSDVLSYAKKQLEDEQWHCLKAHAVRQL
jgi:hypothetical protein